MAWTKVVALIWVVEVVELPAKHSGCWLVIEASQLALPLHEEKLDKAISHVDEAWAAPPRARKPAAIPVPNTNLSCLIITVSRIWELRLNS